MSKIKFDYIVSFSSEDSVHTASNLLDNDVKKKWKCKTPGESSASVILQLAKATKISSIDIGNENSCFVEVFVGRSSSQNSSDYQLLLPMSSFMTPLEAKSLANSNRVRLFTNKDLSESTRNEKWDRIKVMCTQPFNKSVQYGLSFIILHAAQETESNKEELIQIGKFTLKPPSPGNGESLFLKRKEFHKENKSEESTKLSVAQEIKRASTKEYLDKYGPPKVHPVNFQSASSGSSSYSSRPVKENQLKDRNSMDLFYTADEDKPHEKIDKVVAKQREEDERKKKIEKEQKEKMQKVKNNNKNKTPTKEKTDSDVSKFKTTCTNKRKTLDKDDEAKKKVKKTAIQTRHFNELFKGVIFTISGIVNPERASLRSKALDLGAIYKPNWDNTCTHLICAFANTPKFKEVQGKGKIVTKQWIIDCHSQRKRLPWRRYALDRNDIGKPESEDEICEQQVELSKQHLTDDEEEQPANLYQNRIESLSGSDTDDEIERIRAQDKKTDTPVASTSGFKVDGDQNSSSTNSLNKDPYDVNTDEETEVRRRIRIDSEEDCPKLFTSELFYVDQVLGEKETESLNKVIKILNGFPLYKLNNLVDYIIGNGQSNLLDLKTRFPEARFVSSNWIYECYDRKELVPFDKFLLK